MKTEIKTEDIIALEQKLIAGISTSDTQLLDSLLHDDLLFIAPNGNVVTKQMDLASHKAGEMEVEKIDPVIETIKIIDDCAVVVVVYDTRGKMLGNPIQGKFRYIRIWKQCGASYKIIGGSCLKIE